jgi:ATP-dependent DNA ligase
MLSKSAPEVPEGGYLYEPKWDGFRCILFSGDGVELSGRSESITRYFPEVVAAAAEQLPSPLVLDGEVVVPIDGKLDFDQLSQRIHPAQSRVTMLSEKTPAWFLAFDLLEDADGDHLNTPFDERRARLEKVAKKWKSPFFLTPITRDADVARQWFETFEGAGIDGVMAKPLDSLYLPGKRTLTKVKHKRTADCVVAGYRWHKSGPVVGSLLLGLYDDRGQLHHGGVCSAFSNAKRRELVDFLAPYVVDIKDHPWNFEGAEGQTMRRPGGVNRWNAKKDMSYVPLRPELVIEVEYDQLQGDRFRHNPRFARWRPDRTPKSCRFDQLERPVSYDVKEVLSGGTPR